MLSDLAGMVERDIIAVQRAVSDQLTRISNRRGFLAFSKYSLELHRRQLVPATLVFFDLDTFKPINDPHGHAEGDGVLTLFSEQMRDSFLSSDLFARLGGDAFVALLTNADSDVVVTTRGSRFTDGLQHRCAALSLPYSIAFSYGLVSCEPLKHSSVVDMLHEADSAMDRGKRAKR
ncbi:diguanylate cyclase with GAF sensor [Cyanobium sp. PCC 7001]|nr:diguanylate cyclase with GAF sensor [Cyanobium sp. PCC 7001]